MTTTPHPRTIAALDVPLAAVEAEAVLREALAHTHSPSDALAYALGLRLIAHPELIPDSDWTPGETR